MDEKTLRGLLPQAPAIVVMDQVSSTNDYLKAWALQGAGPGTLVLANAQTKGRGRRGNSFFSPAGGFYFSLLLPYHPNPGLMTTLAAVAARQAVLDVGGPGLQIKWVNDLLLDLRKVGGILAEGFLMPGGPSGTVLGLGLNTGEAAFPGALAATAGSLPALPREALAAAFWQMMMDGIKAPNAHMPEYRAHCLTLGRRVRYHMGELAGEGLARDVDANGALLVETATGTITLSAGEARVRGEDGNYI